MDKPVPNLMSALFHWASRQGENFTTECLVWVLRTLLAHEMDAGIEFLSWLSGFEYDELRMPVTITTQPTHDEGRPDVSIESQGLFVFVEVKTGSGLGKDQIDNYLTCLERKRGSSKGRLVLLTQYTPLIAPGQQNLVRCVRWNDVASRLRTLTIKNSEAKTAASMLIEFLKEQIMTVEHVGWEYASGVTALRRLLQMLDVALDRAEIPRDRAATGWEYVGYYLDDKRYWAGIWYDAPQVLVIGYERNANPDIECIKQSGKPIQDANNGPEFTLDLSAEEVHFHAMSAVNQLDTLIKFLRDGYEILKKCDRSRAVP